jgi:hypothetical protein
MIRQWVAVNSRQWRSVRGDSNKKKVENAEDIDGISHVRDGVIYMQVVNLRDMYHAAIRRPENVPGAIIYPSGIDNNNSGFFKHICARQSSIDVKTKKKIEVIGSGREDWLDCCNYLTGLSIGYRKNLAVIERVKVETENTRSIGYSVTNQLHLSQEKPDARTSPPRDKPLPARPPQRQFRGGDGDGPMQRRSFLGVRRKQY